MSLYFSLFAAGVLTIFLPCILPLVPIVLGVSVAGRNPWRPLLTVCGMVVSFVSFTLLLNLVLSQFVEAAILIQTATIYALLLFGTAFLFHGRILPFIIAVAGGLFFYQQGWLIVGIAAVIGVLSLEMGGRVASRLQQTGANLQQGARATFGEGSPFTAFFIGLTLGLVWVPCAGPALGFAFALLRNEPGLNAAFALFVYAIGTAIPLLLIGYGGQRAVHSVRAFAPYTGVVKQVAGAILIATAFALHLHLFEKAQIWLLDHTSIGDIGTRLEDRFFGDTFEDAQKALYASSSSMASAMLQAMPTSASTASEAAKALNASSVSSSTASMPDEDLPTLPKISRAPELAGLGAWFNSNPLTMAGLKGKVVLVDFWTYSCINCIRTIPYLNQYWSTYKDTGKFVLLGVHSPEFVFEKSVANVQAAIDRHDLEYPIVQDNDFKTWQAFANRYWPAKYLIDADGYIRYTHFGEGDYDETDRAIRSLLKEAGVDLTMATTVEADKPGRKTALTSETYLGDRSWPAFGNAQGDPDGAKHTYLVPDMTTLHRYYLAGEWQVVNGERQVMLSESGEIRMRFLGGEMNLVMGLQDGAAPVKGTVTIDGKDAKTFTIDRDDLYNLYTGAAGEHEMVLKLEGKGLEAYAFTFGAGN